MNRWIATVLVVLCFVSHAQAVNETLTAEDIAALINDHVPNDTDTEMLNTERNVDPQAKTVKVTNKDRDRMTAAMAIGTMGSGISQKEVDHVKKWCGFTPKVVYDMAVIKDTLKQNAVPGEQNFEALGNACSNSPTLKAFIQKIKILHFKMEMNPDPKYAYQYKFNEKTGELSIGIRTYGVENITAKFYSWLQEQ